MLTAAITRQIQVIKRVSVDSLRSKLTFIRRPAECRVRDETPNLGPSV